MTRNGNPAALGNTTTGGNGATSPLGALRLQHVILIAGSAGALVPLRRLVRALGPNLDAAVVVTIHHPPDHPTLLVDILSRDTPLPVTIAIHGEFLRPAHVYVAPPGYHQLVVNNGRFELRPHPPGARRGRSADPLLLSAARDFGPQAIGVVLSGANASGSAGLKAIRAAGGRALAQAPSEAAFPTMPMAALQMGVDICASAEALGRYLADHCQREAPVR